MGAIEEYRNVTITIEVDVQFTDGRPTGVIIGGEAGTDIKAYNDDSGDELGIDHNDYEAVFDYLQSFTRKTTTTNV